MPKAKSPTTRKQRKTPISTSTRQTRSSTTTTAKSSELSEATMSTSTESGSEPVWFWKPEEENGYMSQWYSSPWDHEGVTYATAEMWMMIQKAKLFGDEEIAAEMAATTDPKKHKALGREARGFDGKKWNEHKLRIVEEGNWFKFTASESAAELSKQLLATGEREIVEASPLDKIWGVGFGANNAEKNRAKWGQNLLGIALMNVRKRLVEQEEKKEE